MASQTSLDVIPLQAPHLDIDHFALADIDFQIKDTTSTAYLLKLHWRSRDRFLNHNNEIHLRESNFLKYLFPDAHPFLDIIHFTHACYFSIQGVVFTPNQQVLFTITA